MEVQNISELLNALVVPVEGEGAAGLAGVQHRENVKLVQSQNCPGLFNQLEQ